MARSKKKTIEERRMILGDILELIDPAASSVGKRMELFNTIIRGISFAEDDKNKLSAGFLKCAPSEECGTDSDIIKKRDILFRGFKAALPDISLSAVFSEDFRPDPDESILRVYERERASLSYESAELMDGLKNGEKGVFMRWMVFLSCFSRDEKNDTYDYLARISRAVSEALKRSAEPALNDVMDHFIEWNIAEKSHLLEVNIAANHGLRWLDKHGRYRMLKKIVEQADRVNILITEHETAERFTRLMREPREVYDSDFTPSAEKWIKYCREHRDKVTLKISRVLGLHQYLEFHFENDAKSAIFVGFYTYGGMPFDRNHFLSLTREDNYFDLYRSEFRYLFAADMPVLETENDTLFAAGEGKEIAEGINGLDAVDRRMVIDLIKRLKYRS